MKRLLIPATLVLALAALPAFAWHGKSEADCPRHPDGGHGMMHHMGGPDDVGMLMHLLHLSDTLGLTDQQKTDIKAVMDAAQPEFQVLQEKLETARDQWRENSDPANFDEDAARAFAQSQAALHADLMVLSMKTRAEVLSKLTPEQQEQLRQLREEGRPSGRHGKSAHCRGRS